MNTFLAPRHPNERRPPMTPARRRKLILSYLPDWIITIALAAIFFAIEQVEGYKRVFSVEDTSLRHPYAEHERIPNLALIFICFVAPLVLQPVINLFTIRSLWDFHNSTLGLILSLGLTGAITQFTKITVGRPRPDVIDRCKPPPGTVDPPFGLTNFTVCTQMDKAILRDGFRSFPSGHASLSFAGLGFLAFYIAGKLHLFDRRGHAGKAWLSLSPFAAASLVAISRTMDYRHHWHDVLIGGILGTVIAYFSYRQYYPSLTSELSHRPYSPRIKREETLPMHHHHNQPSLDQTNPSHGYHDPYGGNHTIPANQGLMGGRDSSEEYELQGTVKRQEIPLEDVWKDGEHELANERSLPMPHPPATKEPGSSIV